MLGRNIELSLERMPCPSIHASKIGTDRPIRFAKNSPASVMTPRKIAPCATCNGSSRCKGGSLEDRLAGIIASPYGKTRIIPMIEALQRRKKRRQFIPLVVGVDAPAG